MDISGLAYENYVCKPYQLFRMYVPCLSLIECNFIHHLIISIVMVTSFAVNNGITSDDNNEGHLTSAIRPVDNNRFILHGSQVY